MHSKEEKNQNIWFQSVVPFSTLKLLPWWIQDFLWEIRYDQFIDQDHPSAHSIWATSWESLFMSYANKNVQISLRICAVWSAPLLFAAWIV